MTRKLTIKYPKPIRWFHWISRRCDRCRRFGAETYHQRTSYVNEADNIVTLCPLCKQENDEYWNDMWTDLYSGIL